MLKVCTSVTSSLFALKVTVLVNGSKITKQKKVLLTRLYNTETPINKLQLFL